MKLYDYMEQICVNLLEFNAGGMTIDQLIEGKHLKDYESRLHSFYFNLEIWGCQPLVNGHWCVNIDSRKWTNIRVNKLVYLITQTLSQINDIP